MKSIFMNIYSNSSEFDRGFYVYVCTCTFTYAFVYVQIFACPAIVINHLAGMGATMIPNSAATEDGSNVWTIGDRASGAQGWNYWPGTAVNPVLVSSLYMYAYTCGLELRSIQFWEVDCARTCTCTYMHVCGRTKI